MIFIMFYTLTSILPRKGSKGKHLQNLYIPYEKQMNFKICKKILR